MKCTFKIKDFKEIDLERISRENPGAEILLVKGNKPSLTQFNGALLLNNKFLSQFDSSEKYFVVCHSRLNSSWGIDTCPYTNQPMRYHRLFSIKAEDITEIVSELKQAIKILKASKKKITVTVFELNIDEKFTPKSKKDDFVVHPRAFSPDEVTIGSDSKERAWAKTGWWIVPSSLFEISMCDKTLNIKVDDHIFKPDKIILNGQVYEKEIPF